jgi:galactonate dehydratase
VGDKINLMLELHALWSPAAAKKIFEATSDLNLTWIEDPIYPDLLDDYALLRNKKYAPIAHGETISSHTRVKQLLEKDYIDILTLDLGWCGGYTAGIELAKLTSQYGKAIAPHDCTGPIGLISGTHLSTARDNAKVQETVRASLRSWYPKMVSTIPTISNGMITLSEAPGLGTDLSEHFLNAPELITQSIK